mgnify:FL=1
MIDGGVYITGRIKDLIILRGRKLFPQDIEYSAARAHPLIRQQGVSAFSIHDGNAEHLVVLAELDQRRAKKAEMDAGDSSTQGTTEYKEIAHAIVETVSREHEARVTTALLLPPGQIARTSSGKIQRFLCRERFLAESINVLFRWDTTERAKSIIKAASQH